MVLDGVLRPDRTLGEHLKRTFRFNRYAYASSSDLAACEKRRTRKEKSADTCRSVFERRDVPNQDDMYIHLKSASTSDDQVDLTADL